MAIDKFLYFTDSHYGTQPVNRTDDFNESILDKIEQLLKFAEENQCILLMGGDIFDSHKISFIPLIKFIKLFRKYKIPGIYSVIGNHDGKVGQSPLELMESVKIIHLPKYTLDTENCRIIFSHFENLDMEKRETLLSDHKFNILATHENITKEPFIGEHILMSEYKTAADMVLIAHYHPEQGNIKRKDGKIFVSPGALARRKRIDHEMTRIPCASFITVDENGKATVKNIRVNCKMDIWKEKSYLDIVDDTMDYKKEIGIMKNIISHDFHNISIEDTMRVFAKEIKVSDSVVEHCLTEMQNV